MKQLIFIGLLFAGTIARAQMMYQATVNINGNSYTQNGITYEWSVGEMALIETMVANNVIMTNGLLQPDLLSLTTNVSNVILIANNILTPNGDGKNDCWIIKDIALYPNNTVTIFDRTGRIVYTKHGYANDWAGTFGSAPLNEGTYYYLLDLGIGQPMLKGFITILRNR